MTKYNIQLVFDQGDSLWYASYQSFSTLQQVKECSTLDNWWYLGKDKCDSALLSRVKRDMESNGCEIASVLYDSEGN
jgi:hypothetical protein